MKNEDARELLRKYNAGTCTAEEKALVEDWYAQLEGEGPDMTAEELDDLRDQSWQVLNPALQTDRGRFRWYRYAAAVLLCTSVSLGFWIYVSQMPASSIAGESVADQAHENDVLPGGNKAVLSLGDGTTIVLDEAQNGKIAEVNGINIKKTADGQIVYEGTSAPAANNNNTLRYNQIATPRGGQYHVTLPDGTNVWLNAASSLRYPVRFSAQEREVELSGEAYFEVTKQISNSGETVSFVVNTPTQRVEVLGTRFNINAYTDEATVNTTLLEGSVRVSRKSDEAGALVLKPNQQCLFDGTALSLREVDVSGTIAWKEGYFSFERADIKTVMRQLSRWYDLDVRYEGKLPAGTFSGKVDRNLTLSNVLAVLAYSEVNFRIDGKTIIIFS